MADKVKREAKAKVKPVRRFKFGRLFIVLGILIYLSMFVHAFFGQMLKTYIVTYGELQDSDNVTGFVIREEEVIASNLSGALKPIKNEGERTAKGTIVATVFKGSTEEAEQKISEIEDKIQRAIKEQEGKKLGALMFSEDIRKIDDDTEQKILRLCSLVNQGNLSEVIQLKNEIDGNLRKKAEISGEFGPASQYIKNLLNEKNTYENRISSLKESIRANLAGVVSYNVDGLESILRPEAVSKFNIKQLNELERNLEKGNGMVGTTNNIKIVNNFECFITSIIDDKFRTDQIQVGDNVSLRFLDSEEEIIPATIHYISVENDGKALVTFRITRNVESLLNHRKISLDVIWSTSKGIKTPVSSLVKKEGKDGVMVVKANYTRFREVEIIKQDSEYAIIREASSRSSEKGISLYDEVVLNGTNVEEGRQVYKWNF